MSVKITRYSSPADMRKAAHRIALQQETFLLEMAQAIKEWRKEEPESEAAMEIEDATISALKTCRELKKVSASKFTRLK
jgi:hypothetical protein